MARPTDRDGTPNGRKRPTAYVCTHVNVCFTNVKNAFSTFSRYIHTKHRNQYNISPRTERTAFSTLCVSNRNWKPFRPSWNHNRCAAPCVPPVKSHDVSPISNSSRRDESIEHKFAQFFCSRPFAPHRIFVGSPFVFAVLPPFTWFAHWLRVFCGCPTSIAHID